MAKPRLHAKETIVLIKKNHELTPALKKIRVGSELAIEHLIAALTDDDIDKKLKIEIARALIDYEAEFTKQISTDAINMKAAEIKAITTLTDELMPLTGKMKKGPNNGPKLDFSTISDV